MTENNASAAQQPFEEGGMGIEEQTFNRLFAQYGPVAVVDEAWRVLGYRSKDAFVRSVRRKDLPLRLIRPAGRRESFVSTQALAAYLAKLASGESST